MKNRIWLGLAGAVIALNSVACSEGAGAGNQANAGSGGGAGGAGAPPAQGAVSLSVQRPTVNTNQVTCPDSGHVYEVDANNSAPSKTTPGGRLVSGQNGAEISCSVHVSGSTFTFSGTFHGVTNDADHYPITVSFSDGVIAGGTLRGTAAVSVFTPVLAGEFNSGGASCAIQVINQQLKSGSVWAAFSCPGISTPPSGQCSVGESVIVFENCDGS